jgi:hypothetical protein
MTWSVISGVRYSEIQLVGGPHQMPRYFASLSFFFLRL